REWLDDFDAQLRGCPVELRRREKAKAEAARQQKIIALAEAHKVKQQQQVSNQEGWDRYVDGRIQQALSPLFGRVEDGEIVGGVLHEGIGAVRKSASGTGTTLRSCVTTLNNASPCWRKR